MALFMSSIMSLVITLFNIGFISDFILIWLQAWAFGFTAALPTIFLIAPLVRRLVINIMIQEGDHF